MSPVPAVQDLIAQHADGQETRRPRASSSTRPRRARCSGPTTRLLSKVSLGRNLTTDAESRGLARRRSTRSGSSRRRWARRRPTSRGCCPEGIGASAGARRANGPSRAGVVPAAYGMLAPGGLYLIIGFVDPADHHRQHVAVERRACSRPAGKLTFTWEWSNYQTAMQDYWPVYLRSILYAGIATRSVSGWPTRWRTGSRSTAGKWKATLFMMILVPFFVSFVIRTVQWNFILGHERPAVRGRSRRSG